MAGRSDPTDNFHRPMRINREAQTVSKSKVQRLRSDTTFGGINFVNTSRLRDQTLVPDFIFLVSNRCIVIPGTMSQDPCIVGR